MPTTVAPSRVPSTVERTYDRTNVRTAGQKPSGIERTFEFFRPGKNRTNVRTYEGERLTIERTSEILAAGKIRANVRRFALPPGASERTFYRTNVRNFRGRGKSNVRTNERAFYRTLLFAVR